MSEKISNDKKIPTLFSEIKLFHLNLQKKKFINCLYSVCFDEVLGDKIPQKNKKQDT